MTDFAALLATLARNEVEFIVVGAAAAIAHGSPQLTQNLEIVYERSDANLDRLVAALAEYKPSLRGAPPVPFIWNRSTLSRGLNFALSTSIGDLDLLGEMTGGGSYRDLEAGAIPLKLFQIRCLCLSLPQLTRAKIPE